MAEPGEPVAEEPGGVVENRGRFKKGADPRRHDLHQKQPKVVPPVVAVEEARDPVLTAMRWVLENDKAHDTTGLQGDVRRMRAADPKGFVGRYQELERAERLELAREKREAEDLDEDPGEAKARELIDQLQKKWAAERHSDRR